MRNPKRPPIMAEAAGVIPDEVMADAAAINMDITAVTKAARPSRPSVKFAQFTVPPKAMISKGMAKSPREIMMGVPLFVKMEVKGTLISKDTFV